VNNAIIIVIVMFACPIIVRVLKCLAERPGDVGKVIDKFRKK
jgi:hypothetical protein